MKQIEPPEVPRHLPSGGVWFQLKFRFRAWRRRVRTERAVARLTGKNR